MLEGVLKGQRSPDWIAKSPWSWDFSQKFLPDLWCSFFSSFGAKLGGKGEGREFTKNYLFHVHICLLPQILGFVYQATDKQADNSGWKPEYFCAKDIGVSHGNCGFPVPSAPFSSQDQLLWQPAAPRVCSQLSQTMLNKKSNFRGLMNLGEKSCNTKCGKNLRDKHWSPVAHFWVMAFCWKMFFTCVKSW